MLLYNFIASLIYIFLIPYLIIQLIFNYNEWKWRTGLGKIPKTNKKTLWIHASSVGEINGIRELINKIVCLHPDYFIYLSTMTITGYEQSNRIASKHKKNIFSFIIPLDISWTVKKVLNQIKPELLILTETELWPCLIYYTKKINSKILLINGRMSSKSYLMYKNFHWLFKGVISKIDHLSLQSGIDKKRYMNFNPANVSINGNLKFSICFPNFDQEKIKKDWNINCKYLITFGSSRPGEEELVIGLNDYLRKKKVSYQIILAPRHLNRLVKVIKLMKANKVNYSLLSEDKTKFDVLVLDKMGELAKAYSISDVSIIGGSFYNFGGHNPLEAAYFGKPIIMGKFHSNCKKTVHILDKKKAISIVNKDKLSEEVLNLYRDPAKRNNMGKAAQKLIREYDSSLDSTINLIQKYIIPYD